MKMGQQYAALIADSLFQYTYFLTIYFKVCPYFLIVQQIVLVEILTTVG